MMERWMSRSLGLAGWLVALTACSGDDAGPDMARAPNTPGVSGSGVPSGVVGMGGASAEGSGVANYGRPMGMPIGQGGSNDVPATPDPGAPVASGEDPTANEDVEIPVFMPMEEDGPPCTGCLELNVDVDDINQRDNFVYAPGPGTTVTRVVWTIVVPFNSDQLFVQPFVDNAYGAFTELDANDFALDTPIDIAHDYMGPAGTVGIAVGSSGAWTGNMTMSVFIDAVTLEGAPATASRTFDSDVGGFVVGSNANNPKIVYHP
jgi:hypothetical protein